VAVAVAVGVDVALAVGVDVGELGTSVGVVISGVGTSLGGDGNWRVGGSVGTPDGWAGAARLRRDDDRLAPGTWCGRAGRTMVTEKSSGVGTSLGAVGNTRVGGTVG
jgi:hypothetical protein